MNDPTRFTDANPEGPEAALLRSMRKDSPPEGARKALLGVLGLGAVGGVTASAAASKAGSGFGGLLAGKWAAGVGICAMALAMGYAAWTTGTPHAVPADSKDPSASPFSQPGTERSPPANPASPSREVDKAAATRTPSAGPEGEPTSRPASNRPRKTAPQASVTRGLSDEVAALERARRALTEEDNATALKTLAAYDREFRRGALGPEAQVLRIEALLSSGKPAAGRALARRFLARNPSSPLAGRVRSLLAEHEGLR